MSWNHRVFVDKDGHFSVREAYYEEGKVTMADAPPYCVSGDSLDELVRYAKWILAAVEDTRDGKLTLLREVDHGDETFSFEPVENKS